MSDQSWTHTLEIKVPIRAEPPDYITAATDRATRTILPLGRWRSYRFGRDLGLSWSEAFWMARHPGTWEFHPHSELEA